MAKIQNLDVDMLFLEFPLLKRGLLSIGIQDNGKIQELCRMLNQNIYDYVGLREAFDYSAREYARESGEPLNYYSYLEKLERYMTAHLLNLYIFDNVQNIDETPYAVHYQKLQADKIDSGKVRSGNVFSILQACNIGQRIISMLRMQQANIGGLLWMDSKKQKN